MTLDFPEADWICSIGVYPDLYEKFLPWLDEDSKRRLVFVDLEGTELSFDHRQVQIFGAKTQGEMIEAARKIGWKSVFQKVAVLGGEAAPSFERALGEQKEAAHLLISDWADGGESVLKHSFAHWNAIPDVRSALALKDRFRGIPAVICGGGPSLKKNIHLLDRERALIFAGGAALNQIPVEPHFAASIDREAPFEQFKRHPFWQAPFFYQSRMNPKNFSLLHAEKFYVPDGCHPAEAWLTGGDLFDGGWTVGTFLTALAVLFGCDPIIFVGMDLCYEGKRKYASLDTTGAEGLVEAETSDGKKVLTQRDWLMAANWISELSARRWDRTFINATEGGLGFGSKVKERALKDVLADLRSDVDLEGQIHAETMGLAYMQVPLHRMGQWKKSLKKCLQLCKKGLKKSDPLPWDQEIVYQKLLFPLWQIWSPIFERELEVDLQPMPMEEKMRLNQILFFQQVLHEQAN